MKKNSVLAVVVIFVTVSSINAMTNKSRSAKALEDYLNSSPEIRQRYQKNSLVDELRNLNTQYKIPIYLITSHNQRKEKKKKNSKKSLTNKNNVLRRKAATFIDRIEHKYQKQNALAFVHNINNELNKQILKMTPG